MLCEAPTRHWICFLPWGLRALLGILGDETTRRAIIDRLERVTDPLARFVAAMAIDSLAPRGSAEDAAQLQSIIERNAAVGDREKVSADQPLKEVMYRLRARAL